MGRRAPSVAWDDARVALRLRKDTVHAMSTTPQPADAPDTRALDARLREAVAGTLRESLQERREELAPLGLEAVSLVDALEVFLEGGKLLRPRFCFWGGTLALGRAPDDRETEVLASLGAAIELVQAAALIHDDVIDHSPVRRGRPAIHIAAAQAHRDQSLAGDPGDHGLAVAIILGDLALSWAEQLAARAADGSEAAHAARREFDLLRTEVMAGQYLDVLHQAEGFASAADPESAARAVIRWKTVPYTVDRPLRMGAAVMGADGPLLDRLTEWAIEIGTAFQLRDDLLSVVGDVSTTGKPSGGDILEGKRTVLLARTVDRADESALALLQRTVGRPDASAQDVLAVHELMHDSGAVASVREDITAHAQRARIILDEVAARSDVGHRGLSLLADAATDLASLPG